MKCVYPRLTKGGGGHHPLENFSLLTQNQKGSDLSHLYDLFHIVRGHFDEKKWGYHLTRGEGKPSKTSG